MVENEQPATQLPEGEYAIVEVLGHRTLIGRVEDVERFGSKLMSIEPIYQGALLPAVMIGGGSIYQFTPCSREIAMQRAPKSDWQLPTSVRAALPPSMLPAPDDDDIFSPAFLADDEDFERDDDDAIMPGGFN